MNQESTEKLVFRPSARLLHIIGDDLIKDEMAGVIELVKNAHDADATQVTISFEKLQDPEESSIVIEDDGHGMRHEEIVDNWMSPATDVKEREEESPCKRPLLGRKGVGRFSAMRLGNTLRLETTIAKSPRRYVLDVDWKNFKNGKRRLDDVTVSLRRIDDAKRPKQGTKLVMRDLNDEWTVRRIDRLIRELKLLLSPMEAETKDQFEIVLDLERSGLDDATLPRKPQRMEPFEIPDLADYLVTANIGEDGVYEFTYKRLLYPDDEEEKEVSDRGSSIFERFSGREGMEDIPKPLPCGPLQMTIHVWDRDPVILKDKASRFKDIEEMGVRAIRRLLDQMSGVALYRDGFRVRPYGDPDQDWLELAQRRVQNPPQRVGPNQLFGVVEISTLANPYLEDKSSREGLKENDAFGALRTLTLGVLSWLEPIRYRFRKRHRLGRPPPKSTRALIEKRKVAFQNIRDFVKSIIEDPELRKKVFRLQEKAERISDEEHERLEVQAELMHDHHALGLLARFVLHTGRNLDSSLDSALSNLERCAIEGKREDSDMIAMDGDILETFNTSLLSSREVEKRLDELLDQLDPLMRPRRSRRPKVDIVTIVEKAAAILTPQFEEAGVNVYLPSGKCKALAWEADIFHATFNILHNSLYWVQQITGKRRISVTVEEVGSKSEDPSNTPKVEIVISDNGPGVPEVVAPQIYDLSYSEKPDGTGIGLFVAKEAIERSKGTLELVNPGEAGAVFRVCLTGG
jgi:signal transduction histidine kinase